MRPIENGAEYEAAAAAKSRAAIGDPSVNPQDGKPITRLANNAFLNCTELTGIVLSHNLQTISGCFRGCTKLTRVHCPTTLSSIKSHALIGAAA
ncbi:MAG: leucine-rich repeat protein [Christensenellaceae bacterium]